MKKSIYTLISLSLFFTIWEIGYIYFGELILPSVVETFKTAFFLVQDKEVLENIGITLQRVFIGLSLSIVLASALGIISGLVRPISYIVQPIITIMLSVPVIAWLVLAMIWFGMGSPTVIFLVFIATFPIIFVGSFHGMQTIDKDLEQMADSFKLSLKTKLINIYFPHIFSYIFTSILTAIGLSWKVVMMAELISANDGIGSMLGIAQAQIDTTTLMALLVLMVGLLIFIEQLLFEPMKYKFELWRK